MKKFILSLAVAMCAVVSASAQDWTVGGRIGGGLQAVAEYSPEAGRYWEGRLGLSILNGALADFTALHNWNVATMDWTPSAGQWYLDAGVGASIAGNGKFAAAGVVGDVKFGIKFNKVPIRLAIDVSPAFGYSHTYATTSETSSTNDAGETVTVSTKVPASGGFWRSGLLAGGISATYCF